MDTYFIDQLKRTLNTEAVRRLLVKYFIDRGCTDFDTLVNPTMLQQLSETIPQLASRVEVVPHMRNINQFDDTAEIGWNIFVLGNHRQYLGETYHVGLQTLAGQITQGLILQEGATASRLTTPRRIINFIVRTLSSHKGGQVNLDANANFGNPKWISSSQMINAKPYM